jgi:Flp pilus assembly protein TadG
MVEFAFVIVLLIALLYGIISYGLILAAQSTVTQAAADAARSGIVASTAAAAPAAAEGQANIDVGWMGKGTCWQPHVPAGTPTAVIDCTAITEPCPSNTATTVNTCIKVTVKYNYSDSPLFPELPGLGIITPSTISSTNVLQLSTPTS